MYSLINLSDLLFDEKNPRLEDIANQDDALKKIILDQGMKLVNLAKDIVEVKSTNPSELPIVIPSEKDNGKFIVLEGNRRLAVLRLLSDYSTIAIIDNIIIRNEFYKLYNEYKNEPISKLQCYIAQNRTEADHWRRLRHTGANNGVGTVTWDATAVSRFSAMLGVNNFSGVALQVMDHLEQEPRLSNNAKEKLKEVKITNLGRLINDPNVREAIGIKVNNGVLDTKVINQETINKLETIIQSITTQDFKVKQIYNKNDRQKFIESIGISSPTVSDTTAKSQGASQDKPVQNDSSQPETSGKAQKKSNPISTNRKTLIPSNTIIKIGHSRLNKIYKELRTLDIDSFENCAAVTLRVFLELSIDEYATRKNIPGYSSQANLRNKIGSVATYMEENNILDSNKLKAIRIESNNPHSLMSTNTLNAYVHNKELEPKATDLKITWNNIETFIMKLWE